MSRCLQFNLREGLLLPALLQTSPRKRAIPNWLADLILVTLVGNGRFAVVNNGRERGQPVRQLRSGRPCSHFYEENRLINSHR